MVNPETSKPIVGILETKLELKTGLAILLTIASMSTFALTDSLTKYLTMSHSTMQIVWVRYGFFLLAALVLISFKRSPIKAMATKRPIMNFIRAIVLVLEINAAVIAFSLLSQAVTTTLILTFPLFVTLLSGLVLSERVGIHRIMATITGFLGVLLVLRPGLDIFDPAMLFGLLTGFLFAVYNLMTRHLSKTEAADTQLLWVGLIGFICLSIAGPFIWQAVSLKDFALMGVLGLGTMFAHYALIYALKLAPAPIIQPFTFTLLLGGILCSYIFFNEIPDNISLIGAAIIMAAGVYTIIREGYRRKHPEASD